jgi:hypothetical protein
MAFAVHALLISLIEAALGLITRHVGCAHARNTACGAAYSGTDRSTMAASNGTADQRADGGTCKHTAHSGVLLRRGGSLTADRVGRVRATRTVVESELIERLARAGQCHGAWSGRHCSAAGKYDCTQNNAQAGKSHCFSHDCGADCGVTCCHGEAHCCTYG